MSLVYRYGRRGAVARSLALAASFRSSGELRLALQWVRHARNIRRYG